MSARPSKPTLKQIAAITLLCAVFFGIGYAVGNQNGFWTGYQAWPNQWVPPCLHIQKQLYPNGTLQSFLAFYETRLALAANDSAYTSLIFLPRTCKG